MKVNITLTDLTNGRRRPMGPNIKVASKRLFTIVLSFLVLFSTMAPTLQAFAADSTKGIETKVDRTELDNVVQSAKDVGVPIQKDSDLDMGVATTKSEVDAKVAEIKQDYENQIKAIKAEIEKKKECDKKQKEYEEKLAKYNQELEKYNKDMEKYKKEVLAYNQAIAELENHLHEDGYLSQPIGQSLVFKSEPNATVSISNGTVYSEKQLDSLVRSWGFGPGDWGYAYFEQLNKGLPGTPQHLVSGDLRTVFELGKTTTVTYTNLQNSTMNGKKIAKVVFKYTVKNTTRLPGKVPVFIKQDPTATIWYTAFFGDTTIGVDVQFFDEDDKPMALDGALLSFASLNRGDLPKYFNYNNSIEKVQNFNGQFMEINGSTIKNHSGSAYSDTNNAYLEDGSRFERDVWDTETSEYSWYGAIVGKVSGKRISYDMTGVYKGNVWFSLNSNIRAKNIPVKPIKPVPPVAPTPPQCPNIQANYHYDILYYQPAVEKKVTDDNNSDINNNTVLKDSVVKFILSVADLPAGHEKIDSLVFTDKLPAGYKVDLVTTKQSSPDYDVNYDEGTNVITFSAKQDYLNTINADLNAVAKIAAPVVVGNVTKAGTTYKNDFTLTINNDYSVKSNPVKVHTPSKPKKEVFKGDETSSIDGKIVKPGDVLRYEITYKNTTGTKQNVIITDKVPKYTKYLSSDNSGRESGGVVRWENEVENGKTWTVSFKVKVNDDINGKPVDNISHVKDDFNESDTNETHNPTSTQPKKEVFKGGTTTNIDGKRVEPGQELTYAITYKNTTGKDVNTTITDKLPAHTKFVNAENGGTESGGVVKWTVDVAKDQKVTVKFTVKVDKDVNGEPIDNIARVNDGVNDYDTNETHNPTPTEPKKEVFKGGTTTNIDGKRVEPGQDLTYAITYKNTTGNDVNATITDKLPKHTSFVSAENGGTESGGVVTWNVPVAKDQSVTVKFTVKVDANVNGAPIDNVAKVNDGVNDYKTNETHNPTSTEPKKEVFKGSTTTNIDGKRVEPGQKLTYAITYKNTTGKDVNATITDKIPAHTKFVSADNGGAESGGVVKWTVAVAKDQSVTVKFIVKVDVNVNGAPIDNIARVNDGTNEFRTNETHNPTPTEPKKEVFKGGTTTKIDGKLVQPEEELTYTITYKNTTGKDVNATITDKIPAHTKFVSADNSGAESGGVVTWNVAVAKDKSVTVKFTVKVDANVNGAPIDNVAKVNDGVNDYKTNETHNPTPTGPKKEVFKGSTTTNIDGKRVEPGQELTYAITYKNTTGNDVNATITDKIPAHTKFVSADNSGAESGGVVKWTVAVAKDQSITVKFTVKVDKDVNGEPIDNIARVNDGVNDYKTNETHNPTPTGPKKEVLKFGTTTNIDGKRVEPEQKLTYAITYKNTTGKDVNATITDKIPAHTKFVSADNSGAESGGVVKWTVAVAKDQSITVKFTVKVDKDVNGEPIDNIARVNDGVNDYDTNETHNPTPTGPKKEVFKGGTTTNIDGKRVEPGQELTYAITYKNTTGNDVNATITDKIPAHTSFVSAENGGTESGGVVKWTVAVAKDQSITVKFTVKVDANVNGAPIDNIAKVNDGVNDYKTNETHNPTSTEPKKEVFKGGTTTKIDGKLVQPEEELTYAITYKNTTGNDVNATITDKIPAHTKFVSADNGGTESGGVVTWNVAVAKDKSVTVKFTVKVDANVNGAPIDNVAKVNDGVNDYKTNETHNPTPTGPKKEIFKGGTTTKIDGKLVQPEEELTYAITYKNTTGNDVNATITDKIPAHTKFVSADNGGAETGGIVKWNVAVAKDQSITVKFTVKVDKNVNGAPIDNIAKVNDGVNDYKTNETHNPTPTGPKKEVFKGSTTTNIDGKRVEPGQKLTYAITYKNTTGKDVNATITDKLPKHTSFVSADNGGAESGGVVTWNVAVAKDKSVTVKFIVKVDANVNGAPIDNVAKVNDGVNEFDTNETHNPTPTEPKKEVFKGSTTTNIDGKRVEPGQELTYAITYKNTTGNDVNATITDKIPAHTKFVSADNGGAESGGVVKWNVAVAKDKSVTVKFTVKVDANVNGAPIDNIARVNDGVNEFDTNETHNPTPTEPKKEVFKGSTTTNIDGKLVQPEEELTYAITYKNTTGNDVNATITDKIPAHTKFVSADNGGAESGGVVTWNVAVAKDKSITVKFTVKVDANVNGAPIDNVAKVNDGVNEYKTNETHNPTPTEPKKEVFKGGTTTKIDGKLVQPEEELTYEITYKNTTGKDVNATITDKLPAHTSFVSAENGGRESGRVVTWNVPVAKDQSVTVKFTVKVNKDVNGAPIDNIARVNDGTNSYDTNETHNPTPTEPKKEVFKFGTTTNIDGKVVQPDQKLTYQITYKNTTGEERDVTITDKLPAHTSFVSADNGGKFANGKITWTAKVADGQTLKVTFTVKVDKNVNGEILKNTAIVNDGVNDFNTNTVKNPTPKVPKNPDTGDFNNIMLLLLMLLGSSGALVSGMAIKRRREE